MNTELSSDRSYVIVRYYVTSSVRWKRKIPVQIITESPKAFMFAA